VVTTVGDNGSFTYKRSRQGDALPDRAVEIVLNQTEKNYTIEDFFPNGSDERQYCSPGFNLPVGSLMRTRYRKYKEYHTSDDNKSFISFVAMQKSVEKYVEITEVVEKNKIYTNQTPYCEPQLGKRGLIPKLNSQKKIQEYVDATLWLLNLSDGTNDLISIAERSKINFNQLSQITEKLLKHGIIK
jgi:aminopeptidase-like protein